MIRKQLLTLRASAEGPPSSSTAERARLSPPAGQRWPVHLRRPRRRPVAPPPARRVRPAWAAVGRDGATRMRSSWRHFTIRSGRQVSIGSSSISRRNLKERRRRCFDVIGDRPCSGTTSMWPHGSGSREFGAAPSDWGTGEAPMLGSPRHRVRDRRGAVHGRIAQRRVGGLGQLVGRLLNGPVQGRSGLGDRAVRCDQPSLSQPPRRLPPLRLAPASVVPQDVNGDGMPRRGQHVRLAPADAPGDQRGHVAVAAVLTQRRGGLPDLGQLEQPRAAGQLGCEAGPEDAVGPRQDAAAGDPVRAGLTQMGQGPDRAAHGLRRAELGQRGRRRGGPRQGELAGIDHLPAAGHGRRHHVGMEVEEGARHRSGTDPAERRRPRREVAVPEPHQTLPRAGSDGRARRSR